MAGVDTAGFVRNARGVQPIGKLMSEDAFTYVRARIDAIRRAALAGRRDEIGGHLSLAFAGIQALAATGQLSMADQQQLGQELNAVLTATSEQEDVVPATTSYASSMGSPLYEISLEAGEVTTTGGSSSNHARRVRTIAFPAEPVELGEVTIDMVALHLLEDGAEVELWSTSSAAEQVPAALLASMDEMRDRLVTAMQEGLSVPELQERMLEIHQEQQRARPTMGFDREDLRGMERQLAWEVVCTDDVGTAYRSDRGGSGDHRRFIRRATISPSIPPSATRLRIAVLDESGDDVLVRTVDLRP